MPKRSLKILPSTALGIWSVGLIVAMPMLFMIGSSFTDTLYASVPAGDTILEDIALRPALALTMLAGMAAGISAFITGLLAILRCKERALLVYASSVLGALLILFLAGEILFPHWGFSLLMEAWLVVLPFVVGANICLVFSLQEFVPSTQIDWCA